MPRSESECEQGHNSDEDHGRSKPWIPSRLLAGRLGHGRRQFTADTRSPEEDGVPTEESGSVVLVLDLHPESLAKAHLLAVSAQL